MMSRGDSVGDPTTDNRKAIFRFLSLSLYLSESLFLSEQWQSRTLVGEYAGQHQLSSVSSLISLGNS